MPLVVMPLVVKAKQQKLANISKSRGFAMYHVPENWIPLNDSGSEHVRDSFETFLEPPAANSTRDSPFQTETDCGESFLPSVGIFLGTRPVPGRFKVPVLLASSEARFQRELRLRPQGCAPSYFSGRGPRARRSGAISVEYSVLLGLIIAILFVAAVLFGQEVLRLWSGNTEKLDPVLGSTLLGWFSLRGGLLRRLPGG